MGGRAEELILREFIDSAAIPSAAVVLTVQDDIRVSVKLRAEQA